MEKKAAVPMPKFPKRVLLACIGGLSLCVLALLWQLMAGNTGVGILAWIALSASAAVGLARRLAWGRFLFSVISVLGAFAMPGVFAPSIHDEVGTTLLETVFGDYPTAWVAWMITMVAVLMCLLPATIIGIDKDWFRDEKW